MFLDLKEPLKKSRRDAARRAVVWEEERSVTFVALEQQEQTAVCCYDNEGKALPLKSHLQHTHI